MSVGKYQTFFDKRSGRAKRQTPCVNADGKVDVADHVKLSDIIMNQNE